MPTNLQQDNSADFVVEFFGSDGLTTTPSSGTLTISYVNRATYVSTTTSVTLTAVNSFFTGTWSSTGAALGLATWTLTGSNSTSTQATGEIRVIDRVA